MYVSICVIAVHISASVCTLVRMCIDTRVQWPTPCRPLYGHIDIYICTHMLVRYYMWRRFKEDAHVPVCLMSKGCRSMRKEAARIDRVGWRPLG